MKYGFIGTGNMGGALARALVREVSPLDVYLNNRTPAKAEALAAELGARADTAAHIAAACDYIFLGVKPNLIAGVLAQLAPTLAQRTDKPVLVSMAAGVTIAALEQAAPGCPILRIMPNTACRSRWRGRDAVLLLRQCDRGPAGGLYLPAALLRPTGGAGGKADGRRQRRGRLRRRLCLPVHGGTGRRCRHLRPAS